MQSRGSGTILGDNIQKKKLYHFHLGSGKMMLFRLHLPPAAMVISYKSLTTKPMNLFAGFC